MDASDTAAPNQLGSFIKAQRRLAELSQRELAEKLLKSTGNISIVLKHLEEREMITRRRDPADNRYMQVTITPAGEALLGGMFSDHVAGIVAEMSALTSAEQVELGRLCRKLGLREE